MTHPGEPPPGNPPPRPPQRLVSPSRLRRELLRAAVSWRPGWRHCERAAGGRGVWGAAWRRLLGPPRAVERAGPAELVSPQSRRSAGGRGRSPIPRRRRGWALPARARREPRGAPRRCGSARAAGTWARSPRRGRLLCAPERRDLGSPLRRRAEALGGHWEPAEETGQSGVRAAGGSAVAGAASPPSRPGPSASICGEAPPPQPLRPARTAPDAAAPALGSAGGGGRALGSPSAGSFAGASFHGAHGASLPPGVRIPPWGSSPCSQRREAPG